MIKSDRWIQKQCEENNMILPFVAELKQKGTLSYGLTSNGYDVRLASEFKVFRENNYDANRMLAATSYKTLLIDPKNFNEEICECYERHTEMILPPHSFTLARTLEIISMPPDVMGFVTCKSTYARCGLIMPPTILEPAWEGTITLELANVTPFPLKLYVNEGIAQIVFGGLDDIPMIDYMQRGGKYNFQAGVTLPRIKR